MPAATSSATAASASALSEPEADADAAGAPTTSVISPLGGFAKRAAASDAVPRTTSSNFYVSSRQTATSRDASNAASDASVAGSRWGESNATDTSESVGQSASSARAPRGRKPRNWKAPPAKPDATSAVSTADGPGSTVTGTPASSAARTI